MSSRIAPRTAMSFLALLMALALVLAGCGDSKSSGSGGGDGADTTASDSSDEPADDGTDEAADATGGGGEAKQWTSAPKMAIDAKRAYTATIETSKGRIVITLLPKDGPVAVNNFVFLARQGFYDGTPFHRVIKEFMIQGGDPTGTGTGGPGYTIADDEVRLDYEPGIVAMANSGQPNSAGSQFFIMHGTSPLPKTYSIFGRVKDGMDVVDEIASVPVEAAPSGEPSQPTERVFIKHVTITEG